jgi:erythromycin esterase-like protein
MKTRPLAWTVLTALLALCIRRSPSGASEAPTAVSDWIAANAIRLSTVEAGHGFEDLQPLKKVIGDARIVSLGEATHGTREFFQLKHRLLEFLATEMGFSIFSIEASMPESYRVNDFVLTGEGDPARLLKGMYFWTWNTEEVLDMILWIREFNQSGRGKLEFTGFDMQTPTVAEAIVRRFVRANDPAYIEDMNRAAKVVHSSAQSTFGTATGSFPIRVAAGKRVRFGGKIKTEGVTNGYAGLWWRADAPGGIKSFANLRERAPKGTTEWTEYELEIAVPENVTNINFGALLAGKGRAWFDALSVEIDGQRYTDQTTFDFDFESPRLKGFRFLSPGYEAQMDSDVFSSGQQSLRLASTSTNNGSTDARQSAVIWTAVLRHLETSREAYLKQGVSTRETEWAIQNARVVRQCLQMRANEVGRDISMAENVTWILDQNPDAKIVLWAHNGHVATGGYRGYDPMGAMLRAKYGEQMVVVGFAFNQGSFQAIEMGKGLRDFAVLPAPAGSLDATLAATGIPVFALDLRSTANIPSVAEWFRQPQQTRTIGAAYSEESGTKYFAALKAAECFDALMFVEQTTAARKNPPLSP